MPGDEFVHLHTHSCYSLKDGVPSPEELVRGAAELGFHSLALTDHDTLAGIPAFHKACKKYDIKPVTGTEISILSFRTRVAEVARFEDEKIFHATLLAENEKGFQNIVRLVNRVHQNAEKGTPAITFRDLEESSEGLFFLTGCQNSELFHLLKTAHIEDTEEYLRRLVRIFGKSHVYFELTRTGEERERTINGRMIQLANFLEAGIVATNDVHYILPEDEAAYLCLCEKETLLEAGVGRPFGEILSDPEFTRHLATAHEMKQKFRSSTSAIENAVSLAESCCFNLENILNGTATRLPLSDFIRGQDADSYLWDDVFEKASVKYGSLSDEIKERMNREFNSIKSHGLSSYMIFLSRVADYFRERGILFILYHEKITTTLFAYLLGLTDFDPLKFKIRFRSFSSEDEKSPAACVGVPGSRLDDAVQHIRGMFAPGSFCEAGRYTSVSKKSLLSRISLWVRLSREDSSYFMKEASSRKRLDMESYREFVTENRDKTPLCSIDFLFGVFSRLHPRLKSLVPRPGSLAFCSRDLEDVIPFEWNDGKAVSQYEEDIIDALGLHRLKLIPNPALDILECAVQWVRKQGRPEFTEERIDLSDPPTFETLSRGLTEGVIPFESVTVKSLFRRHTPRTFIELVEVISDSGAVSDGIIPGAGAGKNGTGVSMATNYSLCLTGYRSAWIKTHFPSSFMTAVLTHACNRNSGFDRFISLIRKTKQQGIVLKPPSINESIYHFSQEGDAIRTGLMVINRMGEKACNDLVEVRRGGAFNDLSELCSRTDPRSINYRLLSNLIKAGALDCFGLKRSQMIHVLENTIGFSRSQSDGEEGEASLFDFDRGNLFSDIPDIEEFSPEMLMKLEKEATGYTVTHYPLGPFEDFLESINATPLKELSVRHEGELRFSAGFIDHYDESGPLINDQVSMAMDFDGVLVLASPEVKARYGKVLQINTPILIGGIIERNGEFPAIRAKCAFDIEELFTQVQTVKKIRLDCAGPPSAGKEALKRIHKTLKQFPGKTEVEVLNAPGGCGRISNKITKLKIIFCPPVYLELKNLLPPDSISVFTKGPVADETILPSW